MKKHFLNFTLLFSISFSLISCSKNPETAIQSMKDKTDEYLLKGIKPSVDMIVSECSDKFDNNYKDDIKWVSKLSVFEKELVKHINDKILFDSTKEFPETVINGLNFDKMKNNKDSLYFYNKTHTTISNVVFINIPDYINYGIYKNNYELNGGISELGFIELNSGNNKLTVSTSGIVTDIDKGEFSKQGIIGSPSKDVTSNQPYYFYNSSTKQFLTGEQNETSKFIYQQEKSGMSFNDIITGLITNQQITSVEDITSKLPSEELIVWDSEINNEKYQTPIFDKLTIQGEITGIYKDGYLCGVFIKDGKIKSKEEGIPMNSLKRVNLNK